jgi:hypothetical protein
MGDQHQQTLLEEYEEAYFRLLMDRMAEAEGTRLLTRNEALRADPSAAIPEALHKKFLRLISHAFAARRKKEESAQVQAAKEEKRAKRVNFTWSLVGKIALLVILLSAVVSVSFASFENLRVSVMNRMIDVREACTTFFIGDHNENTSGLEILVGWMPDGFEMTEENGTFACTWKTYRNDGDGVITIEKAHPVEMSVDTEDAVVTDIMIGDRPAMLVEKGTAVRAVWTNEEESIIWFMTSENISKEDFLQVAENLS